MSLVRHMAPVDAKVFDDEVAEAIARETGVPIELATRIYKEELRELTCHARITQFVNVLASRRARLRLEQRLARPARDM